MIFQTQFDQIRGETALIIYAHIIEIILTCKANLW